MLFSYKREQKLSIPDLFFLQNVYKNFFPLLA